LPVARELFQQAATPDPTIFITIIMGYSFSNQAPEPLNNSYILSMDKNQPQI